MALRSGVLFLLLTAGALHAVEADSDPRPRIALSAGKPILILPPSMAEALRRFDPGFRIRRMIDYPPSRWRRGCAWSPDCTRLLYTLKPREAPFAVIGDFNGDRILDAVMDGDNRRRGRRVVVLSRGPAFVASEIEPLQRISALIEASRSDDRSRHWEIGIDQSLSLARPKTYRSGHEPRPLVLSTDAFQAGSEKASVLYYLRHGRWRRYVTAD